MTESPVRKHVKPAHDGARIPDPAHPGLDLPVEGASVPWDHYWIARHKRGEVEIVDKAAEAASAETVEQPTA